MIIGICGFIGSGKDTVGEYLCKEYGFKHDSFANPLKDAVAIIFGWDRTKLQGITEEDREWREKIDPYWSNVIGRDVSPRSVLQEFGTECIRNVFHEDVWASSLIKRYTGRDTVVTDCRFKNELEKIKNVGGVTVRVKRGDDPEWVGLYLKLLKDNDTFAIESLREKGDFPHKSETDWLNYDFNIIIPNNGTLDDLYGKIDCIMTEYSRQRTEYIVSKVYK